MSVQKVLRHYESASAEQFKDGMAWYFDARVACDALAQGHGYTLSQVASAMAHLSPRCRWSQNLAKTVQLVETGDTYGMRAHITNARAALASPEPLLTFTPRAMKTSRFARNIIGDYHPVTVDMWAIYAATGTFHENISRSLYLKTERDYQKAALLVGVEPAQLQAIVWIVVRGKAN